MRRAKKDGRTAAERKADDMQSVNSNLAMGTHVALLWAMRELGATQIPAAHKRRMLVLTIRAASRLLQQDVTRARRLAVAHAIGMRTLGLTVALALAVATAAQAQTGTVYTNVVDGLPQQEIVKVRRTVQPSLAVPPSIVSTEVLPRNYRPPLGATSYVPPVPASMAAVQARPAPVVQPWYINGIYAGPSPSGNWMSTAIGRPVVDVNIVGTPRRPQ